MNLRAKTFTIILGTTASLAILVMYFGGGLVRDGFMELEQKDRERDAQRVRAAVDRSLEVLNSATGDWAEWNDSYLYVQGQLDSYATDNLEAVSLVTLMVDGIVAYDRTGKFHGGSAADLAEETSLPVPEDLRSFFADRPDLSAKLLERDQRGLFTASWGRTLFASRPILKSDRGGPAMGALVMFRRLDENEVGRIAELSQTKLRLLDDEQARAWINAHPDEDTEIFYPSEDQARVLVGLRNYQGTLDLVAEIMADRHIHLQGMNLLSQLKWGIAWTGFALAFLAVFVMDRAVLRRLMGISREALSIAHTGDTTRRVDLRGEDEIAQLGNSIDRMLDSLEDTQARLRVETTRAEAAAVSKAEFLANMSHEIRTPLTALIGYSDVLIRESALEDDPDEARDHLAVIHRNGEHLLGLVNDILELSKIESGQLQPESVACCPGQIIEDVISLFRPRADEKSLDLTGEVAGSTLWICSDPFRLRQILVNLVSNAIKFTHEGSVRLKLLEPEMHEDSVQLRFQVEDTGIGIPADTQDRIFEAFQQADGTTTRQFGGTGLGLPISRHLCQLLGGKLELESEPGRGTRFTVTLEAPTCEPVPEREPEPEHSGSDSLEGLRVLVAEDGPDNQRLIRHYLKKAGAEVTMVENGQEALDAIEGDAPYAVAILDMQMPVMDGYTAAGILSKQPLRPPIIALTANALEGDRERCLDAGCDDFCRKPIDRNVLLETIRRHALQGEQA